MTGNEQFDELIRDKFRKSEPAFNSMHWLEAEKMIRKKEKKERNRKIIFYSGFLLLFISGFVYWSVYQRKNSATNKVVQLQQNTNSSGLKEAADALAGVLPAGETIRPEASLNGKSDRGQNISTREQGKFGGSPVIESGKLQLSKPFTASRQPVPFEEIRSTPFQSGNDAQGHLLKDAEIKVTSNEEYAGPPVEYLADKTNADTAELQESEKIVGGEQHGALQAVSGETVLPSVKAGYSLFVLAGGFMSKSFAGTEAGSGFGIDILAGSGISKPLRTNWGVETGVLYFEKSNVNSVRKFYSEIYNGEFGRRVEMVTISAKKLGYLSVPLLLHYQFNNRKQVLEAGASFDWLLYASTQVSSSVQTTGGQKSESKQKSTGYVNGFEKYDVSIHAGYAQHVFGGFNIGVRLHYGILDITRDNYYRNEVKDNLMGLQVLLKYKLY